MKLEAEVVVRPEDADKRSSLVWSLDAALLMSGRRVRAGTYRVTIERVKAPEEKKEG